MEGEAPKRRRGRIQDEIPSDQSRNVTFRAQASVYNALVRRATETGKSVTDVLEALVMQHLLGAQPVPPSLTAEDVRQIVREEMGQRTSAYGGAGALIGQVGRSTEDLLVLGKALMDEPAGHVGPPVPPIGSYKPRFVPAAVAASRGLPAKDLVRRAPIIGDGCGTDCATRKGYCGHQGCPWPNKRERAAMASDA